MITAVLTGYRKLKDAALAASPQITVYAEALLILFKQFYRSVLVTVNLPQTCMFGILAVVFYESLHILKRVSEKNADLVRESHVTAAFITAQACS